MQTTLLSTPAATASTATAPNAASFSSDMFTKLLVAQIQNQDPTAPTDPSTYVNQLTQLSQTESLQKVADLTSANSSLLQSMQVLALGAQIGSSVTVSTDHVKLGAEPVRGVFTLASASANTDLVLTGADGIQHKVALGSKPAGDVPFAIDAAALGLAPGSYSVQVAADGGQTPAVQVASTLASVKLSSTGSIVINVNPLGEVSPSAITSFNGVPKTTPN